MSQSKTNSDGSVEERTPLRSRLKMVHCAIACCERLRDAEDTRRRTKRSAADARQYAIADFARELLAVAGHLHGQLPPLGAIARAMRRYCRSAS